MFSGYSWEGYSLLSLKGNEGGIDFWVERRWGGGTERNIGMVNCIQEVMYKRRKKF